MQVNIILSTSRIFCNMCRQYRVYGTKKHWVLSVWISYLLFHLFYDAWHKFARQQHSQGYLVFQRRILHLIFLQCNVLATVLLTTICLRILISFSITDLYSVNNSRINALRAVSILSKLTSNPAGEGGGGVECLTVVFFFRRRFLRRADLSPRGSLPSMSVVEFD